VRSHLFEHDVLALLLVGSSARGYAVDTSDVDFMAFYDSGQRLPSTSTFTTYRDVNVTLEHHDLHTFLDDTLDHRFNLGSLRMLLKVRDGVAVSGENDTTRRLMDVARLARLDDSILLCALDQLVDEWPVIRATSDAHRRHLLIRWIECLASLDLLNRANGAAYSKPKWLFKSLRAGGLQEALSLLEKVGRDADAESQRSAIEAIASHYDAERLPAGTRGIFRLCLRDARAMLTHAPAEAGPVVRFLGDTYYRRFCDGDPLDGVSGQRAYPIGAFEAIFSPRLPAGYREEEVVADFVRYARGLATRICDRIEHRGQPVIGSRNMVAHFLGRYAAMGIFPPHVSLRRSRVPGHVDQSELWQAKVRRWCETHG